MYNPWRTVYITLLICILVLFLNKSKKLSRDLHVTLVMLDKVKEYFINLEFGYQHV
jgi:hypothetical protein